MKAKFIIILIIAGLSLATTAQNAIYLKNKKVIKNATLYEIKEHGIVYEKGGSLHDLAISRIRKIINNGEIIVFDEKGKPIYLNRKTTEDSKKELKTDSSKTVYQPTDKKKNDKPEKKEKEINTLVDEYNLLFMTSCFSFLQSDPNFRLGIEFEISESVSIYTSHGVHFNNTVSWQLFTNFTDINHGYSGDLEFKIYNSSKATEKRRPYYGIGVAYKYIEYTNHRGSFLSGYFNPDSELEAIKNNFSIYFKSGKTLYKGNSFVMDMYVGLGFRYRSIKEDYYVYDYDYNELGNYEQSEEVHTRTDYTFMPELKLGMRIGFGTN